MLYKQKKPNLNHRPGKLISLMIFACLAFTQTVQARYDPGQQSQNINTTDRIIVKYKNSSALNMASALSTDVKNNVSSKAGINFTYVRRMSSGAHIMKLKERKTLSEITNLVNSLNNDPDVEYAEPDLLLKPLAVPNDSRYNEQWHYYEDVAGLNLPPAWDITQGAGAVVAVIDTGYLPHNDLSQNMLSGYDMISDTAVSQDGDGRDADASDPGDWAPADACGPGSPPSSSSWHGTHVAGTVAAVGNNSIGITGVAYAAKIVPVRALGRCGGYTSDISDGIIWAAGGTVASLPINANPANVINLSLGGSGNCGNTQQNAIDTARSLGATVIVAAGNDDTNVANSNPANCSGVVTVAAVNRNGARAFYSNFGDLVDVAAPGGDTSASQSNGILSTLNTGSSSPGNDTYSFYQGTSMATPHVAGAAALLYSVNPSITPDDVELILKTTSRAFPATCSQCGSGIVDASAAVNAANGDTTTPPPSTINTLVNGVAVTALSDVTGGELRYTIDVPAGATGLQFQISGGTGDADLYVKYGSAPTNASYDCRPYLNGNNETCNITIVRAGTYHVMVQAYASYSDISLIASYTEPDGGAVDSGLSKSNLSGAAGQWRSYTLDVPAGMSVLNIDMTDGTGDADLYVRYLTAPTLRSYNCRPYLTGNNESCAFNNPQAGTWYIRIRGYSSYAGVSINANYQP